MERKKSKAAASEAAAKEAAATERRQQQSADEVPVSGPTDAAAAKKAAKKARQKARKTASEAAPAPAAEPTNTAVAEEENRPSRRSGKRKREQPSDGSKKIFRQPKDASADSSASHACVADTTRKMADTAGDPPPAALPPEPTATGAGELGEEYWPHPDDDTAAAAGVPVPPPADSALRNRIEKLAEYVARNSNFEDHVKSKQLGNADFAFLTGGDGSAYYQQEKRKLMAAHAAAWPGGRKTSDDGTLSERDQLPERSPLLVLIDLNGVLVHRAGSGAPFKVRPGAVGMLTVLWRRVDVAFCSSMKHANAQRAIAAIRHAAMRASNAVAKEACERAPIFAGDEYHFRNDVGRPVLPLRVPSLEPWRKLRNLAEVWATTRRRRMGGEKNGHTASSTILCDDTEGKCPLSPENVVLVPGWDGGDSFAGGDGSSSSMKHGGDGCGGGGGGDDDGGEDSAARAEAELMWLSKVLPCRDSVECPPEIGQGLASRFGVLGELTAHILAAASAHGARAGEGADVRSWIKETPFVSACAGASNGVGASDEGLE